MYLLLNILLFLSGVIGAAGLLRYRFPQFEKSIIGVKQFKGIVGFCLLIMGLGVLLDLLFSGYKGGLIGVIIKLGIVFSLGIIQGAGIVQQMIKHQGFNKVLQNGRNRLVEYEEILGMAAMIAAVLSVFKLIF